MPKALSPIARIAGYTLFDEVRHKSFLIMLVVCAIGVLLVRGCYQGDFLVNGQHIAATTVVRALSKVTFHLVAVGAMVIAALLSMRVFTRDRNEGMQACVLSKPIARWQYVAGKLFGIWVVSVIFMFILHGMVFLTASFALQEFMPGYLAASLLCSLNLLFVVVAVLLFSLLMPDIVAFLCVFGVGIVSFVGDGLAAASRSQIAQMMLRQPDSGPHAELTWWEAVYWVWPKLLAGQQAALSVIGGEPHSGLGQIAPLLNVLLYALFLGAALFLRFRNEDIN